MFKTLIAYVVHWAKKREEQYFARRFNRGHADALQRLDDHVKNGASEAEAVDMVTGLAFMSDQAYYRGTAFAVRGWQARRITARRTERSLQNYERKHQEQNRT